MSTSSSTSGDSDGDVADREFCGVEEEEVQAGGGDKLDDFDLYADEWTRLSQMDFDASLGELGDGLLIEGDDAVVRRGTFIPSAQLRVASTGSWIASSRVAADQRVWISRTHPNRDGYEHCQK